MKICELKLRSSFLSSIESNTLFGGICWSIRWLYGVERLTSFLKLYKNSDKVPLTVSSVFPKINDVYFIPIPNYPIQLDIDNDCIENILDLKKINKLRYISVGIYNKFASNFNWNKIFNINNLEKLTENIIFNHYLALPEEIEKIKNAKAPKNVVIGKNRINRLSGTTSEGGNLFFLKEIHFHSSFSQYFFYELGSNDYLNENEFNSVMRFLGEEGLGGDRSSGYGKFIPEFYSENPFNIIKSYNYIEILSNYYPNTEKNEFDIIRKKENFIKIQYRRAKIESSEKNLKNLLYKKGTFFITQGSLISVNNIKKLGKLVNLRPTKPSSYPNDICELGIPIFLPYYII
ncbi:MAG: type III-A CRISPR-associated RAMP protein Csm4 [Promethearchaeia archaeon]